MEPLGDIQEFLRLNDGFEFLLDKNKIKCKVTGHELPCNLEVLKDYVAGKKYQRLTGHGNVSVGQSLKFKKYLEPVTGKRDRLFCKLTRKTISNTPVCIERHVQGKRFQKALEISLLEEAKGKELEEKPQQCMGSDPVQDSVEDMEVQGHEEHLTDEKVNCQAIQGKKHTSKGKRGKTDKIRENPDDDGSEEGEEDLEGGTIVLWVPSDHEFEEEEDDPWASYFEHLKPEPASSGRNSTIKSIKGSNGIEKSRKRKSKQSFELSYGN